MRSRAQALSAARRSWRWRQRRQESVPIKTRYKLQLGRFAHAPAASDGRAGLTADFWLDYREGETLGLLYPLSEQAKRWRRHHIDPDALEYNGAIAVEHRFIRDITDAIRAHGLRLEVN